MAQMRYVENQTVEQLLQAENEAQGNLHTPLTHSPRAYSPHAHSPRSFSSRGPSLGKSDTQDEDPNHPTRKSVLTKVKEKAKKWRNTLSKKKQGNEESNVNLSLEEVEDEEDPEYHGAPMYESEHAPYDYRVAALRNQTAPPVIAEKVVLEPRVIQEDIDAPSNKTLTQTVTEILAPAYAIVSEATNAITSKIQSPGAPGLESSAEKKSNAGITTVKEYLKQKLEPGEDERALSQVISEAISPRKVGKVGEMSVVEKVREAVASLLRNEEQTTAPVSSSPIPVSTNPREEIVEVTHERRLQTN